MTTVQPVPFEELLKRNPELKESDIQILREWCEKQPHLPKISNTDLAVFLHSNYYRIEPTKTTIDTYYSIRSHVPEFFNNRDPLGCKELRSVFNVACHMPLEGQTADGYQIVYGRLLDRDPSKYDFNEIMKYWNMITDLWIRDKGTVNGHLFVIDVAGAALGHSSRLSPMGAKKYVAFLQEGLPVRIKGIHFINVVPVLDIILNILKPLLKKELLDILHIHSTHESLAKYIPVELLPNESGGKAGPILELHEKNIKRLEANRDWFREEEQTMRVNETLRPGKAKTATDLFGVEGSFKKLEFD